MFKQVIPDCQYSNIDPRYIELMYDEEDGKENQDIELIIYKYIMNNKIKQMFITKNEKIPSALNKEIQELYDVMMKDNLIKKFDITAETFIEFMYQQNITDETEEQKIKKEIEDKYSRYKKIVKYTDDDTNDKFAYFMGGKEGAKVFTYHKRLANWSWLDDDCYKEQFKQYKKLIKEKKIVIDKENNNEHMLNGKKWYSLCIQKWNEEIDDYDEMTLCKGSIEVFGYMISGYVYYFQSKKDRDNAYNWLVK